MQTDPWMVFWGRFYEIYKIRSAQNLTSKFLKKIGDYDDNKSCIYYAMQVNLKKQHFRTKEHQNKQKI